MEKTCSNHPESLALATCKACEKSICLMCVCDEKEGTFCSTKCIQVFREVSDWVEPGSAPVAAAATSAPAAQPEGSVFDPDPPAPSQGTEQAEFEPLVTPGTKWRMIGSVCAAHTDTPAVATCEACDTTVCALCVVEADNGTYCAACAAKKAPPAPAPVAAAPSRQRTASAAAPQKAPATRRSSSDSGSGLKWAIAVVLAVLLGGGGWVLMNSTGGPEPTPDPNPKKDPVIAKTDPVKVDPTKKVDPPKVDPKKVDPPKVDPPKVDPPKVDPTKKVEPKVGPKKVEPPPKPKPPGVVANPWTPIAPGAWYRMRIEKAGKASYADLVLKARDAGSYTLSTPNGDVTTSIPPYWVKGEETLTIDGQRWICEVREWESPPLRRWVLVEGKNAGAVLKEESPKHKQTTTRLWEHTLRLGRRALDCLVIEGDLNGAPVKTWYCALIPVGPVKWEMGDTTTTLVEMGDDAKTRPAPPK